jgi:serine/threonine protein kinase/tetratricopeptide (TPR) repeat protein
VSDACISDEQLLDLVEGRLAPDAVQGHIDSCATCRALVADTARAFASSDGEAAPATLAPGSSVGRFLIERFVGAGAMGAVYAAYDPRLDRRVALKLLRPERWSARAREQLEGRLVREAQAAARLSHPNVITVFEVGTLDEQVFIAMELVDGTTVRAWLAERARGWREVLDLYRRAGEGLRAAHAAGLVHRDFKPDNVLVGRDGRVRVSDFGLARFGGDGQSAPGLTVDMTQTGAILGTPAYMSPAQLDGRPADASSDVFSFCVSLYEGLYGERPFTGTTVEELRAQLSAGRVREPRGAAPAWVRRAVVGVLTGERRPSMHELLDELGRDPERQRRKVAIAAAVIAVGAVGVAGLVRSARREAMVCRGAEAKLAGVWDAAQRARVHDTFTATGLPFAEPVWQSTARLLDDYARRWQAMYGEACEATRVRGVQSEEVLDLRMECLGERLESLRASTEVMARGGPKIVERAVRIAGSLPSIDEPVGGCGDVASLRLPLKLPSDPARRAQVAELRKRIATLKVEGRALRSDAVRARAVAAVADARALGYRPVEAEALYELAMQQQASAAYGDAEKTAVEAALAAEAGRHDGMDTAALGLLVHITGYDQHRFNESHEWERRASAAVERMGSELRRAVLLDSMALVALSETRPDDALKLFLEALPAQERESPHDPLPFAKTLDNIGEVYQGLHRPDDALAYHRRALALLEGTLGPDHPDVAITLNNLANVAKDHRDFEEARRLYERSIAIYEKTVAPDHPYLLNTRNNLALALNDLGRHDEALVELRRVLAARIALSGPSHPIVAVLRINIADVLRREGRWDESRRELDEALAIPEKELGPEYYSAVLGGLAECDLHDRRLASALELYRHILAIREKLFGAHNASLFEPLAGIARGRRARPRAARPARVPRRGGHGALDPGAGRVAHRRRRDRAHRGAARARHARRAPSHRGRRDDRRDRSRAHAKFSRHQVVYN